MRWVVGAPKDPTDPTVFHKLSLIAFLAWVGLGADGLSSSAYGPDEAFRALAGHEYLALYLAVLTALTVFILSYSYTFVVEHFPTGGGGYIVASKLLGPIPGVVSGSALVVDYVLTVTLSIAAGVDAILSFLPLGWQVYKVPFDLALLFGLIVLNMRGVKESVKFLLPIFVVFVIAHVWLIGYGILAHAEVLPAIVADSHAAIGRDVGAMGLAAVVLLFFRAYSLGGGTYTGIEAVSNGLQILREPRVATAKRTMALMATSLAITAGGILVCYLLWHAGPEPGKTMNAVLLERVLGGWQVQGWSVGRWLVVVTLVSEGALLLVAAQTGFIDGPRVLANMATDSWLPHRFANLSERLVTKNGIVLMGLAAAVLLVYTRGRVSFLVVLYSINVFLTFSLTQLGMSRMWVQQRHTERRWLPKLTVNLVTLMLCIAILTITTFEKFREGGWLTFVITSSLIAVCILTQRHYRKVRAGITELDAVLLDIPHSDRSAGQGEPDPAEPVAVMLVSGYSGLGIHSLLSLQRLFPGYYHNLLFVSVGVVDSGHFKGRDEVQSLIRFTEDGLQRYVALARQLGFSAGYRFRVGADILNEAEALAIEVAGAFPRSVFFLGKLVFDQDRWIHRLLHNDTAFAIQRRLQFSGVQTVVLPIRMRLGGKS